MEQKIPQVGYLVDTNIFLEFLLKQERREESVRLMQHIERGTMIAHVTSFTLHSIEVIVEKTGTCMGLKNSLIGSRTPYEV